MRRIGFSTRLQEASCGVRGELLKRGSGVRISAPAPLLRIQIRPGERAASERDARVAVV
jgi:hypothetical protein